MAKKIALFNHKGGVSKTTTVFNLGWKIAETGKKVLLVDTDPQENLTGMMLGFKKTIELETFYSPDRNNNIRTGLAPAFESQPKMIEAPDCVQLDQNPNLYLLPGHLRLSEYEVTLGIAQELSGSIQTLKNLPGAFSYLLEVTAERYSIDYVLIDMSPSLSSLNQNFLMTSDYFIVPTCPDYFSVMAIDSLATFLPNWASWLEKAKDLEALKEATYKFPKTTPKFLGTIIQKYRPRSGNPARAFQKWIDEVNRSVITKLVPALGINKMLLDRTRYDLIGNSDYNLAQIADFNSLIAISQEYQVPVFAISDEQLSESGHVGPVGDKSKENRATFDALFKDIAEKVIGMIDD